MRRFSLCLSLLLLCSCMFPSVKSQAVSRVSPPLGPVGLYDLRGDPDFSPSDLPAEMQLWYERLWEGIAYVNEVESEQNPTTQAQSGNTNAYGRPLNNYVTSLLSALRVTKDLAFLDEIDRVLELMRLELKDYNADGYLNWRHLRRASGELYGDDLHEMDDILTHSAVAAATAALKENAPFKESYGAHAAFWTDYLKNHFEAKWRERNDTPSAFPFASKDLMHPYAQFIRYHYYMYKLTGDARYYAEAERMALLFPQQMRTVYTAVGPAYVWNQRFLPDADGNTLSCQPFVYLRLTFQAFTDLAMEGFSVFNDACMQHVAASMTQLVMKNGYKRFASDICGGVYQAGMKPSGSRDGITFHFVTYPYAEIGKWDPTQTLLRTVEAAYTELDLDDPYYVRGRMNLSNTMLFLLADRPDRERP